MSLAKSLEQLLEEEFNLLKGQDLDGFEAKQTTKNDLLQKLTQLTGITGPGTADTLGPQWDPFKSQMADCRDLHRRNEILISRKIDAIRGALQSLQVQDPTSSVEIYDRLGKMARTPRRGRGFSDV